MSSIPKYKKTDWHVVECKTCQIMMAEDDAGYCSRSKHQVMPPRENVPFIINNLSFIEFCRTSNGGAFGSFSGLNFKEISIPLSEMEKIIPLMNNNIVSPSWFMWGKRGGYTGLKFLGLKK